jgi:hypothetical protein
MTSYFLVVQTNTAWVRARRCKFQKGCTRHTAASAKAYQLLAHGRWYSADTPASSITKTGHHDIAEILIKVALNTIKIISNQIYSCDMAVGSYGGICKWKHVTNFSQCLLLFLIYINKGFFQ